MEINWKTFFTGKRITQIGLGLLGRGVGDAEFLAEMGAELTVTDLKTAEQLKPSVERLAKYKNIKFVLGEHRLEDFSAKGGQAKPDFILKGAGVPIDSPYIAEARRNNISIEMSASLFVKLAPKNVKIIGVTGTRGKTTTTMLIYEILKKSFGENKVFLGGNIKDTATLPLLKEVKDGDYVVMELDSWQLQGFGESKISPNVSVFTTFYPDHMNYYKNDMKVYFADKANIFKYQKKGDVLIVGEQVNNYNCAEIPERAEIARTASVPKEWSIKIPGEHNLQNIACAILATRALKVSEEIIREVVENFGGVPGRLEFIREINGVKIYNDTTSTTPEATVAGLRSLGSGRKNIVLIIGGDDKNLDMSGLIAEIPKYCRAVVMFKERGTDRIKNEVLSFKKKGLEVYEEEGLEATVKRALSVAQNGDFLLYSPAFSSFGKYFKNEYERGEQFVELVKRL